MDNYVIVSPKQDLIRQAKEMEVENRKKNMGWWEIEERIRKEVGIGENGKDKVIHLSSAEIKEYINLLKAEC